MRIVCAFLANYAEVHNGMVFALGGCPSTLDLPGLPHQGTTHLVITTELDRAEMYGPLPVIVSVLRTRDDQLLVEGPVDVSAASVHESTLAGDWPVTTSVAIPVGIEFDDVGRHRIEISYDGVVLWTVNFGIRLAVPPGEAPPP